MTDVYEATRAADRRERSGREGALVAALRAGDQDAFASLAGAYRAELQLHCYRILGSFHESEDLVQETLLRAWHKRESFQGRSTFRAWLYGIATNACLDALRRRPKRLLPPDRVPPSDPTQVPGPRIDAAWLEPFPDALVEAAAANDDQPEQRILDREATEIAFLAAIQHLPPRQRAVLILRDVLGWPASQTAECLDGTVAAVNSALQRAHAALGQRFPLGEGSPDPSAEQRELADAMVEAWEDGDADGLAALLTEDARLVMPPNPSWYDGRDAVVTFFAGHAFTHPDHRARNRAVATRANGRPAVALYRQTADADRRRAFALLVLRPRDGRIGDLVMFHHPELFGAWGLPDTR